MFWDKSTPVSDSAFELQTSRDKEQETTKVWLHSSLDKEYIFSNTSAEKWAIPPSWNSLATLASGFVRAFELACEMRNIFNHIQSPKVISPNHILYLPQHNTLEIVVLDSWQKAVLSQIYSVVQGCCVEETR